MDQKQEELFWETLKIFNEIGISAHVMLIGSWAEYFYKDMFKTDFRPEIRTRDIDFMYRNISIPDEKIPLIAALTQNGYLYTEDPYSGVAKFYKEDLLELEFLTRVQGSGKERVYPIRSLDIKSEGLREINILADFALEYRKNGLQIILPEPAVYVIQKILTNPTRVPVNKKEKDIRSVKNLLVHILQDKYHLEKLKEVISCLSRKQSATLKTVCQRYQIEMPFSMEE